jgi:DNA segregation ATPase FtsK/SpoIIIE, S-DNA-T family
VVASIARAVVRWAGLVLPAPAPERLTLPAPPAPAVRPAFPLVATLAPVAVSLALWMLTQSIYSLLFAALGPIVAVGGLVDGRVGRRRTARRERARYLAALDRTAVAVAEAEDRERQRLERLAPAGGGTGWGGPRGGPVPVRVGRGTIEGAVDLAGDEPDDAPDEVATALRAVRAAAADLPGAPIVVDARDGIGIVGPPVLTTAVARAIAVRIAARLSPVDAVVTTPPGEPWTDHLPHSIGAGAPARYEFRDGDDEPIVISWAEEEADLAVGCGILISAVADGGVTGGHGVGPRDVVPDALTRAGAAAAASRLHSLAEARGLRPVGERIPGDVALADLLPLTPLAREPDGQGSLPAPIGRDADGPVVVDLVAQGPHAVIAGTTGSGKSELLIAWILGMASGRTPDEVTFLLVDFKGGSAFAPLAVLPHVLATLSDLDTRRTDRAIESMRAELRHRERVLAAAGARSIDDLPSGVLARLVIVVDEFAAVVSASPELHDVFGDLAARGRSLGLHLILCTQRPAGVIRDAVLANATLRLSLRVTDRADSMAILGSDAAARLPSEPRGRAVLLYDGAPRMLQLARAEPADAARIAAEAPPARAARPWCEPLPLEVPLDSLPAAGHGLAFGLMDLPAEQRQPVAAHDPGLHGHLLVLGGAGAGSSTALRTLAVSAVRAGRQVRIVPPEPADAWAVLAAVAEQSTADPRGEEAVLLLDDLDALVARFDTDYRHEFLELLTGIARGSGNARPAFVVAAHRLTGPLAGLAGIFGSRLLLRQTSREEHVLAGGDPRGFDPDLPPGAGTWRGAVVQVARANETEWRQTSAELDEAVPVPCPVIPADHPVLAIIAGRPRAYLARLRATGARVIELGGHAVPSPNELRVTPASSATVLVGDPEAWLADWAMLAAARRDWPMVLIDATAADHRALLRDRALPPPLGPTPGECWLTADGRTRRATLMLPEVTRESEENPPRNR